MIYIAYKYTNIKDKKFLRENLEVLSEILESIGKKTFVLLRDKKKWGEKHNNKFHSAIFMLYKLVFASHVLVFVDNDLPSPGLDFEIKYAKFLGKPITLVIKEDIKSPRLRAITPHIIEFSNYHQLNELKPTISKTLNLAHQQA